MDTLTDPDAAADAARDRDRREEDRMRTEDRNDAEREVERRRRERYDDDPDTDVSGLKVKGSGLGPDRPLDDLIVDPKDDIEFGVPEGAVPMDTPEQRNEAFDKVLRELFAKKGVTDADGYIDADTRALGELWAAAGGFSSGNIRASLIYRLDALIAQGFARRLREGKGRRPAQYRISHRAIEPPAEIVDTEPDDRDLPDGEA